MSAPALCTARPRTLEHKLEYLLFIATLLLRASQNLKSKNHRSKSPVYSWRFLCLIIAWISFNLSSIFGTWKVWWWQMNTMAMYSKCKWMLPPTNFFLFDISPRPMRWTPRWRSLRSSILPVRQTGEDGCGTWPRSGGEWWSVAWLPGPWPPEMSRRIRRREKPFLALKGYGTFIIYVCMKPVLPSVQRQIMMFKWIHHFLFVCS